MINKLNVYIFGDYQPHSTDGLLEFSSQNANLLKDDFNFHFIRFSEHIEEGTYSEDHTDGFIIHSFGTKNLSKKWLPKAFKRWLKSFKAAHSLFHLNHIYTYNNYVVARTLLKNDIPYLITPHDTYVYSPEFRGTKPLLKKLYRDTLVYFTDRFVLNNARLIHELTDKNIHVLQRLTKTPIVVIPNQIKDMSIAFDSEKLRQQLCFIGRFDISQKGIDRSLEGFARFKRDTAFDSSEIVFTLIGPANTQAMNECADLCRNMSLEIGKDVIFAGRVSEEQRNKTLGESKIYIHLSRFEGFGLSIIQALSAYTPVIVSRQIPISDKIAQYKAGFVIDTPEETALALKTIFSLSPEEYSVMAHHARACYEKEFHAAVIKKRLADMYKKVVR
jgi:glycosyltransferase involved in cell wall biosynthesis